ncbi:MAG: DUF3656 domain-containing U32 family peptidase [Desulfitobacteriaceae bacterium]
MELLAPAGSFEAFKAAVENEADAIYLGGKSFNARASADNFDLAELRSAIRYAHERRVKVFVTVNILIADREFPELIEYLYSLYEIGADAVILQDPGVAWLMQDILPEMEKHASTQMTVNNHWGVRQLELLGFSRAVLAREVSAQDMEVICASTPLEIEVFVHGALCICYSGQCLMSSFIGGRSGNRGTCAQPCRLTYVLVNQKKMNVLAEANTGEHLLSPRDLNLVQDLAELQKVGVDSLKVEGRMKRPEYVATVTRIYRQALERLPKIQSGQAEDLVPKEVYQELTQIFNRDFTTAYFYEHPGAGLMSYNRPNNRGTRLGRIAGVEKGRLQVKLEALLNRGDGIEIWTGHGREGLTVEQIWVSERPADEARSGETVTLEFSGQVRLGDRVFKTHDALLMERARLSFEEGKEQRKYPLEMHISGKPGEEIFLEATDGRTTVIVASSNPAQIALKRPITEDYLRQQLGRLGTTPYYLDKLELSLEGSVMLPVSDLNDMRRRAVEGLLASNAPKLEVSSQEYHRRTERWLQRLKKERQSAAVQAVPRVSVAVSDLDGVKAALGAGARRILLGGEQWRSRQGFSLKDIRVGIELCQRVGAESVWRLPRILNEEQSTRWQKALQEVVQWERRPILMIANLGELQLIREIDPDWSVATDYSLNVFNEASISYFLNQKAKLITLSPELHHEQLKSLAAWPKVELLVFGDLEMMVSEYCPVGATLGGKRGEICSRPCLAEPYYLRDRMNYDFPVETDVDCRMHLFNVKCLNLYSELGHIAGLGIKNIRLQLSRSDAKQVSEVVRLFVGAWQGKSMPAKRPEQEIESGMRALGALYPEGFTKGHFFRGVL